MGGKGKEELSEEVKQKWVKYFSTKPDMTWITCDSQTTDFLWKKTTQRKEMLNYGDFNYCEREKADAAKLQKLTLV